MDELKKLKEHFEGIAGSWNGEDNKFIHEGEFYSEEQAQEALEISEACEDLINKIMAFNF